VSLGIVIYAKECFVRMRIPEKKEAGNDSLANRLPRKKRKRREKREVRLGQGRKGATIINNKWERGRAVRIKEPAREKGRRCKEKTQCIPKRTDSKL